MTVEDATAPPLLPCPFCGRAVDPKQDDDVLYPSGLVWRPMAGGLRSYHSHGAKQEGDGDCWDVHCPVTSGGCGAEVGGDSKAEAIAAWNRRPSAAPAPVEVADAITALRTRDITREERLFVAALIERLAAEKAEAERKYAALVASDNDRTENAEARAEAAERDAERLWRVIEAADAFARARIVTADWHQARKEYDAVRETLSARGSLDAAIDAARAPKDA